MTCADGEDNRKRRQNERTKVALKMSFRSSLVGGDQDLDGGRATIQTLQRCLNGLVDVLLKEDQPPGGMLRGCRLLRRVAVMIYILGI